MKRIDPTSTISGLVAIGTLLKLLLVSRRAGLCAVKKVRGGREAPSPLPHQSVFSL